MVTSKTLSKAEVDRRIEDIPNKYRPICPKDSYISTDSSASSQCNPGANSDATDVELPSCSAVGEQGKRQNDKRKMRSKNSENSCNKNKKSKSQLSSNSK